MKKLFLILLVLLVLGGNVLLNTYFTDAAVQARTAPSPSPTPVPTAEPTPTPALTPTPSPTPPLTPSPSPTPSPEELERQLGQQIADYALGYWGYKYKYGGESVEEGGFDCSGLVYHCYEKFGYRLERVAAQQAKQGVEVPPDQLQPGDVLCFYTSGKYVGHVGIYVGNNCYIHAMGEAYGVLVTPLDHPDLQREFTARRFVGCEELKIPQEAAPATA